MIANITSSTPVSNTAVKTEVELYDNNVLITTCTCSDRIMSLKIERIGQNSKFFGFGILHKLTLNLLDLDNTLVVVKGNNFKVYAGFDTANMVKPYPTFYVDEVTKDESTNILTITAYDISYKANNHIVAEIPAPYTLASFAGAATTLLGVGEVLGTDLEAFSTNYPEGANFDSTENYKLALDAVAEATQTIYYVNYEDKLVFKRLDITGEPVILIDENVLISLSLGETKKLTAITHATELGDNVTAGVEGITQYIRNNPFWENRTDIATLVNNALSAVGCTEITQFNCNWIGNFALEPTDKIAFNTKNGLVFAFLLNDAIDFNGTLLEATEWVFEATESESADNPSNLGDAINKTFAKVDKVNKEITLLAGDVEENRTQLASINLSLEEIELKVENLEIASGGDYQEFTEKLTALELTTEGITASVSELNTKTEELDTDIESVSSDLTNVSNSLSNTNSNVNELSGKVTTNSVKIGQLEVSTENINLRVSSLNEMVSNNSDNLANNIIETTTNKHNIATINTELDNITARVEDTETQTTTITDSLGEIQSKVEKNTSSISSLQLNTDNITASVNFLESNTIEQLEGLDKSYEALAKEVSLKLDADAVNIEINKSLENGVNKVETSTGFTFDDSGLTITKSDSELSTKIDEAGLSVYKNDDEVLKADNTGVKAKDLHATTHLIIGSNTYMADYYDEDDFEDMAGIFWTGN